MAVLDSLAKARRLRDFEFAATAIKGTRCFHCGTQVGGADPSDYPITYWQGTGGTIYLHPDCTVELTIGLGADASAAKGLRKGRTLRRVK